MIGKTATVTIDGCTYEATITKALPAYEQFKFGNFVVNKVTKKTYFLTDGGFTCVNNGRFWAWGTNRGLPRVNGGGKFDKLWHISDFTSEKYERLAAGPMGFPIPLTNEEVREIMNKRYRETHP